jgi:hypothetical protein
MTQKEFENNIARLTAKLDKQEQTERENKLDKKLQQLKADYDKLYKENRGKIPNPFPNSIFDREEQ